MKNLEQWLVLSAALIFSSALGLTMGMPYALTLPLATGLGAWYGKTTFRSNQSWGDYLRTGLYLSKFPHAFTGFVVAGLASAYYYGSNDVAHTLTVITLGPFTSWLFFQTGHQAYWLAREKGQHVVWMEIQFELGDDERLPERYREVLEENLPSPISLYCRWSLPTIPRVDEKIHHYNLGTSCWVVSEVEYSFPTKDTPESRIFIRTNPDEERFSLTLTEVFGLCEMDVQDEPGKGGQTLAHILRQAGLATTWEEYETERSRPA